MLTWRIFLSNMDNKEFLSEDRKSAGIAFMNANNAASAVVAASLNNTNTKTIATEEVIEMIRLVRNEMLVDYAKYHSEVVNKVGAKATDQEVASIIALVARVESIQVLGDIWVGTRQGLRDNDAVRKAFNDRKAVIQGK
jgi:hypothetical protein